MIAVLIAHAALGAWLVASPFVLGGAARGGGSEIVCGALSLAVAAGLAATRITELRWVSLLVAFWLLAWTMFTDLSGPLVLSNVLAGGALLALAGAEGELVRRLPARPAPAPAATGSAPEPHREPTAATA